MLKQVKEFARRRLSGGVLKRPPRVVVPGMIAGCAIPARPNSRCIVLDDVPLRPTGHFGSTAATSSPPCFFVHVTTGRSQVRRLCDPVRSYGIPVLPSLPSHANAIRTMDDKYSYLGSDNTMNLFGGGKLGMYTYWLPNTTYPNTGAGLTQFEFYDLYHSLFV